MPGGGDVPRGSSGRTAGAARDTANPTRWSAGAARDTAHATRQPATAGGYSARVTRWSPGAVRRSACVARGDFADRRTATTTGNRHAPAAGLPADSVAAAPRVPAHVSTGTATGPTHATDPAAGTPDAAAHATDPADGRRAVHPATLVAALPRPAAAVGASSLTVLGQADPGPANPGFSGGSHAGPTRKPANQEAGRPARCAAFGKVVRRRGAPAIGFTADPAVRAAETPAQGPPQADPAPRIPLGVSAGAPLHGRRQADAERPGRR